jgi:hypothetical protein
LPAHYYPGLNQYPYFLIQILHRVNYLLIIKFLVMKTFKTGIIALSIATAGLFAFKSIDTGSIKGTITPADGATKAWALSNTDTLKADIQAGSFEIMGAKAGTYRLIIEAKPPYRNTAKDNVAVTDGQPTNVGEIKLNQ